MLAPFHFEDQNAILRELANHSGNSGPGVSVSASQAASAPHHAILRKEQIQTESEVDRRVAERTKELAETNEVLKLQVGLLQHLPVSAWTLKPDGTPDFVNQVWLEFAGQTLEFVQSCPDAWMTVVHPEDREIAVKKFWEGVRSGHGFAFETRSLRARDKTYRWHLQQAVVLRDAQGNVIRFVGTTTDIDDLKRGEEALRESEQSARLILDGIAGLVAIMSPSGETEAVNRQTLEYFGKTMEQLKGWSTGNEVHPDDLPAAYSAWMHSVGTRSVYDVTHRLRRADGVYRWFHARGLPLCGSEGQVLRWYVLLTDIDDRKQAEEALRQAQSDLARINRATTMGELTASLAHELSQPISGALTNATVCLRRLGHEGPDLEALRTAVNRIARDVKRAAEIIGRIRSQFEKSALKRAVIDVNETIRETIALLRDEGIRHNISFRAELADDLPPILGDRVQLQQVAMNLIVNGIEAMKDVDGVRELVIKSERADSERILASFTDTGLGFAPKLAEQIFDPFFTTKPHGTGMGLRISRSIVESHGGRLWAVGSAGRGATFHLTLPAAAKSPSSPTDCDSNFKWRSSKTAVAFEMANKGVRYETVQVDSLSIFFREAGPKDAPTLLLLHGFPSSSRMFESLLRRLSDRYHLIAPDYPGFGHSDAPGASSFAYTFDHIAAVMDDFVETKGLSRYSLYVQDYGGPVGFRLAAAHPERVESLIIQNAVAHEDGLGPLWATRRAFWADRATHETALRANFLSFEATRQRHLGSDPDTSRYDPDLWTDEFAFLSRPGQAQIQSDLFYDYRTNVASYPQWQAWLRERQPRLLVLWGKYDPSFQVAEAAAYQRDVKGAQVHVLDAGHFALDTHADFIAENIRRFLSETLV